MAEESQCAAEVAAAGGGLSRAEAQAILQQVMDQADREGIDPMAAARAQGDIAEAARIMAKREQLGNLKKRIAATNDVESRIPTYRAKYGKQGLAMSIRAVVRNFNTTAERSRASIENMANFLERKYLGGAMNDLYKGGLLKALYNDNFMRQVGKEMYHLSMKAAGKESNVGVTGNKQALAAATILHGYQELAKRNLNKAGAWIGDYAGYITKTSHDGLKMFKLGKDGWIDFITPKLDQKTFDGVDDQRAWLGHVYDALVTNVHVSTEGRIGMKDPAFKGASNLAKKLSQSRELHFKDDESWLDYQQAMGTGPIREQIFRSLGRAGKDEALMGRLGTNARSEYEALIQRMEEKYLGEDNEGVRYLREHKATLLNEFSQLDGTAAKPANILAANFFQGMRNIMSMAHLGNVAITHMAAMGIKVQTLKSEGVSGFTAWGNVLDSLVQGAHGRGHDKQKLYDLLLSGFDGQHAHYLGRFTPDDGVAGSMSKATSLFMKYTGLNYVLTAQKMGAQAIMARELGMQLDRDFAHLEPETQVAFKEYGITPQDWEHIRSVPDPLMVSGRPHLTPDAAMRVGLSETDGDQLANKFAAYYEDVSNRAIVKAGVAEKSALGMGAAKGTPAGEAIRSLLQFKTWPISATRQVLGTELNRGNKAWGSRAVSMASLAASVTVLGYLRNTTTDLLNGKAPKNPANVSTILGGLAAGGGMGILADVLFSQGQPDPHAIGNMLAGPLVSSAFDPAYYAYQKILQSANSDSKIQGHLARDLEGQLVKTTIQNTPFVNLWYTRTALDYLFIWHLQEMMNPGYQRRYQQRINKQGQRFWLSPARAVQSWPPPIPPQIGQ